MEDIQTMILDDEELGFAPRSELCDTHRSYLVGVVIGHFDSDAVAVT